MKVYVVITDEDFTVVDKKVYTYKADAEKVAKEHNDHWSAFYYTVEEYELCGLEGLS